MAAGSTFNRQRTCQQRLSAPTVDTALCGRVPAAAASGLHARYHRRVIGLPTLRCVALCLAPLGALPAAAAPFTPTSDSQVLQTVPSRASDPQARALQALRLAWQRAPRDLGAALAYARACFGAVAADGDPRHIGHAQAALQPWLAQADPPPPVRVLRAQLLQFDHQFGAALADLDAVLRAEPGNGTAWSWRTAILMVQADYAAARRSCDGLAPLATPLVAAACRAQVDAATGRAGAAADALRTALAAADGGAPAQGDGESPEARLWAWTRLAETEERRGAWPAAEAAFKAALALGLPDVYLLAAYADFLLDRDRPAEVLALLQGRGSADVLLLRLALAARASGDAQAATHTQALAARFAAARQRGDSSHQKEESRFLLALQGDTAQALQLARQNFSVQKEPADARILLEAALAARRPADAQPVLDWMAASGIESVALQGLAARLKALR